MVEERQEAQLEEAREKEDEKNEAAGEEVEEEEVKEEEGWQGSSKCVSARATLSGRDVLQKDGPGPVMVSDSLCPAVHILGT